MFEKPFLGKEVSDDANDMLKHMSASKDKFASTKGSIGLETKTNNELEIWFAKT
jgi:hypothetical protein